MPVGKSQPGQEACDGELQNHHHIEKGANVVEYKGHEGLLFCHAELFRLSAVEKGLIQEQGEQDGEASHQQGVIDRVVIALAGSAEVAADGSAGS